MSKLVDSIPATERHIGYWVDLRGVQFEDSQPNTSWMQAFPVGEYKHPIYGKIKMTVERARNMARNVIHKVRGIDLAVDYSHNSGGPAAGWVKSAEARNDGLWLFVEWTEEAAEGIRTGKWRYFSPEFVDEWKHPQSGEKFKDVLFGGGLTNRPFLKNILPVNLSEVLDEQDPTQLDEGGEMEKLLQLLREKFELADDASEDSIIEVLNKALSTNTEPEPAELDEAAIAKVLEEHPALEALVNQNKVLAENNKTLAGRVINLEAATKKSSASAKLAEWHNGGLPTSLDKDITSFMLSLDESAVDKFSGIIDEVVKTGLVPLGEHGRTRKHTESGDSSFKFDEMENRVKELMEEHDMDYADAAAMFFRENEEAYQQYVDSLGEGEG